MRDARVQDRRVETINPSEQRLVTRWMRAGAGGAVELLDSAFEDREPCHKVILRGRGRKQPHTATGLGRSRPSNDRWQSRPYRLARSSRSSAVHALAARRVIGRLLGLSGISWRTCVVDLLADHTPPAVPPL